jgi:2-amino-4-hydroxy-6-hydroxymethyldihydropteridine diphosphokinase
MKPSSYHLILGSNLGDRAEQLSKAKALITVEIGPILKESRIYETEPWGYPDQPWFLNQVVEVSSPLEPFDLLKKIKRIEQTAGRQPAEKWHARHIDIDILLAGEKVVESADLSVPHAALATRNFVLVPLMDLIPEWMHPVLHKSIEELYLDCRDTGEVYIFNPDEQVSSV